MPDTGTNNPTGTKLIRCAIYTRKSHEEGLEQEFNSLDAQRESAEAYIESQRMQGWRALPDRYDDGGFSGGNTNRAAKQQPVTLRRQLHRVRVRIDNESLASDRGRPVFGLTSILGRSGARQHLHGLAKQHIAFTAQFVHPSIECRAESYARFQCNEFVGFEPEKS